MVQHYFDVNFAFERNSMKKHHQYSLQEHHFYWSCERLDKSTHLTSFLVTDFNLRKTFLRRYFGSYFTGDTEECNWWNFFLKIWKQTEDVLIDAAMDFCQISTKKGMPPNLLPKKNKENSWNFFAKVLSRYWITRITFEKNSQRDD